MMSNIGDHGDKDYWRVGDSGGGVGGGDAGGGGWVVEKAWINVNTFYISKW